MNSLIQELRKENNIKETENGGIARKSTMNKVYDLFAFGGAYRERNDIDCILLFKEAFEEDPVLAIKCLFYIRDIVGGQGERRFFRVCYKWLCNTHPDVARRNLSYIANFGRWDDVLYVIEGTKLEKEGLDFLKHQFVLDLGSKTPSLLGKWLPSINASAAETIRLGHKVRKAFGLTQKGYRKALSELRSRINIVEKLMSENRWEEIEFDKVPSLAGLKYKNAFAARDIISKKYEYFIKDETSKVNTKAMFPYEIVRKVINDISSSTDLYDISRLALNKYWDNLPNYLDNSHKNILCVCDTSGSMTCGDRIRPIDIAISLSLYTAEKNLGSFKDTFISFSSKPTLVECQGVDLCDKILRIYNNTINSNTDLDAVFNLLKEKALKDNRIKEDLPEQIIVISDMEIDEATRAYSWSNFTYSKRLWTKENTQTNMEKIRMEWAAAGLKLPKLIYWNVNARNNTILDSGDDVSFVSGASPVIFESICKGITGWDLCLEKLLSSRYKDIK